MKLHFVLSSYSISYYYHTRYNKEFGIMSDKSAMLINKALELLENKKFDSDVK